MSDGSAIQWTEATWNVVTGCTRVSEGCTNCYIERTPPFRMAHRKFDGPHVGATTGVKLHSERLHLPLKWRKPRRIFVNSLSDMFHEQVPTAFVAETFAVMSLAERHVFQLLTKRPARMRSLLRSDEFWDTVDAARRVRGHAALATGARPVELPNVWVGVSVEDQQWADIRIPQLLETPAAVRWISAEPLLGPVDLWGPLVDGHRPRLTYWLTGRPGWGNEYTTSTGLTMTSPVTGPRIDWVVAGGESGPGARPMELAWVAELVRQCQHSGVPVFVKQLGSVWARDWSVGGRSVSAHGDHKGGDPSFWDADLRVREFPAVTA